jgi:hypothetical protein
LIGSGHHGNDSASATHSFIVVTRIFMTSTEQPVEEA